MQVGEALRLIRTINGLKQKELADELEISDSHISEIERGNREPSLTVLQRYAEFFEIPVSSILLFAESIEKDGKTATGKKMVADKLLAVMRLASRGTGDE